MRKDAQVSAKRASAFLLGSALLLAGCANLPATTVYTYGDQATRIMDDLLKPVFWMALGVFLIVQGALVYTVWRFRSKQDNSTTIPAQIHGNTKIEIAWTVAPAIVVLVIAVLTFRTQAANSYQPPEAIKIKAIAHQWWFEFQYNDGALVTASDMYIPVGQPVQIQLEAADVMHNFWVPKLAGKTYMIPGKTNYISFTANEPGIYRAFCAEFCGEAHAQMRFRVIAVDPAEFVKWQELYAQIPTVSNTTIQVLGFAGDAQRGAALFADVRKQCISCHVVDGVDKAVGKIGPNLNHYGSRVTIAAGVLPYSTENLAAWLKNPEAVKQGNLMGKVVGEGKAVSLTDQEIADMVAYLDSMKLTITLPEEK